MTAPNPVEHRHTVTAAISTVNWRADLKPAYLRQIAQAADELGRRLGVTTPCRGSRRCCPVVIDVATTETGGDRYVANMHLAVSAIEG